MTARLERPADRGREDIVAGVLAREMGITLRRPETEWFDYIADDDPQWFIEMKCRTVTRDRYPTIILSADKVQRVLLCAELQPRWTVGLFVVSFSDGDVLSVGLDTLEDLTPRPWAMSTAPHVRTIKRDLVLEIPLSRMIPMGRMLDREREQYNEFTAMR